MDEVLLSSREIGFVIFFLFFLSLFFTPVSAYSSIQFYFQDSDRGQACKEQVQKWMDEANGKLPEDWIPEDFIVVFSEDGDHFFYNMVFHYEDESGSRQVADKVIRIAGGCEKPYFLHEYGHVVLDEFMRRESPPWRYYVTRASNSFFDVEETRERLIARIEALEKVNGEHKERLQKDEDGKSVLDLLERTIRQTEGSIDTYHARIARFDEAIKVQDQIPVLLDWFQYTEVVSPIDNRDIFYFPSDGLQFKKIVSPYLELFADAFVVLIMGDWSVLKNSIESDFKNKKMPDVVLPNMDNRREALQAHLDHRDFRRNLSLENYPYAPWEAESPYYQFAPIRSMVRGVMEDNPGLAPGDMINALGLTIIDIYENELIPHPERLERSLLEKNRSFARNLRKHL